MDSTRLVRWLCWALVGLAILAAIFSLGVTFSWFVPYPNIPDGTDLVVRLDTVRAADTQLFPFILFDGVVSVSLFAVIALLGVALRPYATGARYRDVMATLFILGGVVGIVGQTINIAVSNAATFGYCDCGYKTEELISQDYALSIGFAAVNWLGIVTAMLVGLAAAAAGRLLVVSSAFRTLSYLIAVVLVFAVVLRLAASLIYISAINPFQVSDLAIAFAAGILVPIWAVLLLRGLRPLTAEMAAA